jgi:hypothetical protein
MTEGMVQLHTEVEGRPLSEEAMPLLLARISQLDAELARAFRPLHQLTRNCSATIRFPRRGEVIVAIHATPVHALSPSMLKDQTAVLSRTLILSPTGQGSYAGSTGGARIAANAKMTDAVGQPHLSSDDGTRVACRAGLVVEPRASSHTAVSHYHSPLHRSNNHDECLISWLLRVPIRGRADLSG